MWTGFSPVILASLSDSSATSCSSKLHLLESFLVNFGTVMVGNSSENPSYIALSRMQGLGYPTIYLTPYTTPISRKQPGRIFVQLLMPDTSTGDTIWMFNSGDICGVCQLPFFTQSISLIFELEAQYGSANTVRR